MVENMEKLEMLNKIKDLYEKEDINIIQYLKSTCNQKDNDLMDILISYDFQAGSYTEEYYKIREKRKKYLERLSNIINDIGDSCNSILECGVGEATVLIPLLNQINCCFEFCGGFDISWSRVKFAQKFADSEYSGNSKISLVVGDMFNIPCADNSYDIVFTRQALEPNRGKEKELLNELYRVTNKYLILIEPAYELASEKARKRMDEHGYIQNLYSSAMELDLKVTKWELYGINEVELNPVGLMIIEKNPDAISAKGGWNCPLTKAAMTQYNDSFYSKDSLLAYPILEGVPLLTIGNAVVATRFNEFN